MDTLSTLTTQAGHSSGGLYSGWYIHQGGHKRLHIL